MTTKVTKDERQAMLKKCEELRKGIDDLLDFQEIKEWITNRNDDADYSMWKTVCFLSEVLELFPDDPADDPIEEEEDEA